MAGKGKEVVLTRGIGTAAAPRAPRRKATWLVSSRLISVAMACTNSQPVRHGTDERRVLPAVGRRWTTYTSPWTGDLHQVPVGSEVYIDQGLDSAGIYSRPSHHEKTVPNAHSQRQSRSGWPSRSRWMQGRHHAGCLADRIRSWRKRRTRPPDTPGSAQSSECPRP